jgi:hypothetical protein
MLEHGVRISVCCMHIFCMHIGKAIPYDVRNYHKKSNRITYVRKCQIFTSAIKQSLIFSGVLS